MTRRIPYLLFLLAGWGCGVSNPNDPPDDVPDQSHLVFDESFVHEISIEVDPNFLPQLRLDNDDRVPCDFTFDGLRLEGVGIRLKGRASGREMIGKPSFSLKFDSFTDGQRLYGLKKLTINNEVQFPYFFARPLGYEIWRRAGVPAPRTSYASLSVNGEYFGLYLLEEAYDNRFLTRWFEDTSGNLYEGEGSDVTDPERLDLDTNEEENDRSDLLALAAALNVPDAQLLDALAEVLDLDQFYTYWAVERLTYHWDGYGTVRQQDDCCGPNNYSLYFDPERSGFVFLPRGIDQTFQLAEADVGRPPAARAQLAARLFALPEVRAELAARMEEILDSVWDVPGLSAYIQERAELALGAFIGQGEGQSREERSRGALETSLAQCLEFLAARPDIVRARLAQGL